jgi:CheY-like chemotaxis protein/two-component sensor histidine kinase
MNSIIGFSEFMTKDQLPDEKRKYYASIITKSSRQLLNIVNDVLDISRIESGIIKPELSEVPLNELINDAYQLFCQKSENSNVAFIKECPAGDDLIIKTDRVRLLQIFTNLLNNAFKFTSSGQVKLGYKRQNDELLFFVEDTGEGIGRRNIQKIFNRFWQEKTDLTESSGGTGLGLSICKQLVEMLGGEIRVDSEKGKGTTFSFTHPFTESIAKPEKFDSKKRVPEKKMPQQLKILIADDEKVNNIYIRELLKGSGLNAQFVENGKEATLFCERNPDTHLVLMDIKMPVMNGEKAMQIIKQSRPDLPVIAYTAYAMDGDKEKFMKSGFDDYLSKPFSRKQLFNLIERYRGK